MAKFLCFYWTYFDNNWSDFSKPFGKKLICKKLFFMVNPWDVCSENYKLICLFSSIDFFIANTIFSTSYAFIKSTSGRLS